MFIRVLAFGCSKASARIRPRALVKLCTTIYWSILVPTKSLSRAWGFGGQGRSWWFIESLKFAPGEADSLWRARWLRVISTLEARFSRGVIGGAVWRIFCDAPRGMLAN